MVALLSILGYRGKSLGRTGPEVKFLTALVKYMWQNDGPIPKGRNPDPGKLEGGGLVGLDRIAIFTANPPFNAIGGTALDEVIAPKARSKLFVDLDATYRQDSGFKFDYDTMESMAEKEDKVPLVLFDLRYLSSVHFTNSYFLYPLPAFFN